MLMLSCLFACLPLCSAAAPEAADAPAAAVSAASPSKQKRPPEDIAYDGISFLLTSLRTFYMGTAKAVHSPARRREEQASVPGVPMKAAALNLAALLVGNFQLQPWQQYDETAEAKAGFAVSGVSLASSSKPGSERVEAAALVIRSRSGHYLRLTEELNQVLFDNRRRYCHLLVLNYFAALGGMKVGRTHSLRGSLASLRFRVAVLLCAWRQVVSQGAGHLTLRTALNPSCSMRVLAHRGGCFCVLHSAGFRFCLPQCCRNAVGTA